MVQSVFHFLDRWQAYLSWLMLLFLIFGIVLAYVAYRLLSKTEAPPSKAKTAGKSAASEKGEGKGADNKASLFEDMASIRRAFSKALDFLRSTVQNRSPIYGLPWYLFLGERGGEKRIIMQGAGLEAMVDGEDSATALHPGSSLVRWWFFNKGAVLDVDSTLFEEGGKVPFRDKLFAFVLRQLRRHRPLRPVDGIILSIPVALLLPGTEDGTTMIQDETVQRAKWMYSRLCLVQRKLGMRLPVYVVVTSCEHLEGFEPLCATLSASACDGILGWSTPYTVETAYSPAWPDECFAAIFNRLSDVQLSLFGQGEVKDANAMFGFPDQLRKCFPALRLMLDKLFTPSAYHEAFLLRGVYFTGQAASKTTASGTAKKHVAVFVRDLLNRKIFAESALATPTSRAIRMGGRLAVGLKAAAVFLLLAWGGGMVHGYYALRAETQDALPVFLHVEETLKDPWFDILRDTSLARGVRLRRVIRRYPGMMHGAKERAVSMFNGLTALQPQRFSSVVFPSSLIWGPDHALTQAMRVAFDRGIMTAVDLGLTMRADTLYKTRDLQGMPMISGNFPYVDKLPEFETLEKFTKASHRFANILGDYNSLNATGSVKAFIRVMRYALDLERSGDLPLAHGDRLPMDEKFLEKALQGGSHRQLRFLSFRPGGAERFEKLANRLGKRLFELNPVLPAISDVARSIDDLQSVGSQGAEGSSAVALITANVQKAQRILELPSLSWMSRTPLNLGGDYNLILEMAGADPFIGSNATREANNGIRRLYGRFLRRLKSYSTPATGRIIMVDKGFPQPRLARSVDSLVASLGQLKTMRFMGKESEKSGKSPYAGAGLRLRSDIPAGTYPWWNVGLLEEAVSLLAPYDAFMEEGVGSFPPEIRGAVSDVAGAKLGLNVMELLVKAQGYRTLGSGFEYRGDEGSLGMEVRNFNQAGPYLIRLLHLFDRLGMAAYHDSLASFTDLQTMRILRQTDQMLQRERLFMPVAGGLARWNGRPPVAPRVFGLTDLAEVRKLFEAQAKRMEDLAFKYAEPALAYLYQRDTLTRSVSDALVAKWEVILREVDGYQNKRPGNALQGLSNYLMDELKQFRAVDILSDNATRTNAIPAYSYFELQRNLIQSAVDRRSLVLCTEDFSSKYAKVADYFNANLSGCFPFGSVRLKPSKHAHPEVLAAFFQMLDTPFMQSSRVLGQDGLNVGQARSVKTFIERMTDIRSFLGAFGPNARSKVPQLSFAADFRTLRDREINANQLIGWTLSVGEREFVYPEVAAEETPPSLWTSGDEVELALRWAKDSPYMPDPARISPPHRPLPRLKDNATMAWTYKGPWALLGLMRDNAATVRDVSESGLNRRVPPGTLIFRVPTRSVAPKAVEHKDALLAASGVDPQLTTHEVRVFMQMDFLRQSKDGKPTAKPVVVEFPTVFPKNAPVVRSGDLLAKDD